MHESILADAIPSQPGTFEQRSSTTASLRCSASAKILDLAVGQAPVGRACAWLLG